jgi:hypothetical protein
VVVVDLLLVIPVPIKKVRKNEELVYPLRSKAPGGTSKYPFKQKESSDTLNWNGYRIVEV